MSELKVRKAFQVIIRKKEYDVFDIEGKEHEGYNDVPKTWWLYFSDRLPEGTLPPHDSEYFVPYHVSIERLNWDIKFTQNTSTKEKWGETQFRSNTHCEMWCNGKLVYSFGTTGGSRGMSFAMAKAQYMQTMLCEHSFNFLDAQKEQGRKIWWYGLPATVGIRSGDEKWEITIIPDYSTGIDKETWWNEFKTRRSNINEVVDKDNDIAVFDEDDDNKDYINWGDAFSDQNIDWHRSDNVSS